MIQVVAAIIFQEGKYLICQRGAGGSTAYLWEFPGGKLEEGETLEQCLIRECKEELDIDISPNDIFAETTYKYPDKEIAFTFFTADIIGGDIKAKVHEDIKWVYPEELKDYVFCPADVQIVNRMVLDNINKNSQI